MDAYKNFLTALKYNVYDCGMACGVGEEEMVVSVIPRDDAWYCCCECNEPIYFCDWKDHFAETIICPVCDEEMEDEE